MNQSNNITVKFWGVRGSFPVPGEKTLRYGGNTSCIEIRNKKHILILDAGTGIIPCGEQISAETSTNGSNLQLTVLLSHTHHDHIQGLPFFKPAYNENCSLFVYGPQLLGQDLVTSLTQSMHNEFCPINLEQLKSNKIIENFLETKKLIIRNSGHTPKLFHLEENIHDLDNNDLIVTSYKSKTHPTDGVSIYKIQANDKTIIYSTDTEGIPGGDTKLIEFAKNADLLIHDAQYIAEEYMDPNASKLGYGHSTVDMACEVAKKADVKKLILYHHDPGHDDQKMDAIERHAQTIFPNAEAGKEGLEINLI